MYLYAVNIEYYLFGNKVTFFPVCIGVDVLPLKLCDLVESGFNLWTSPVLLFALF